MSKVNFLVGNVSSYAQKYVVECFRKDYFVGVRYYDRTDKDGYSTRHAVVSCYQDKNDLLEYHEKVQRFNAIFDKLPSPIPVSVQGDLPI